VINCRPTFGPSEKKCCGNESLLYRIVHVPLDPDTLGVARFNDAAPRVANLLQLPVDMGEQLFIVENQGRHPLDRAKHLWRIRAALRVQEELGSDTTVHFWFLACSGASITAADVDSFWGTDPADLGGMLDNYNGAKQQETLSPQVDRLRELIQQSALAVDALLMTTGANDTHWATVAQGCLPMNAPGDPLGELNQFACLNSYKGPVVTAFALLPDHFNKLGEALNGLVRSDHVFLTEYFNPVDSLANPSQAGPCLGEVLASSYLRRWAIDNFENPLQDAVQNAAQRFG
jgi:hypothetical protein